MNAVNLQLNMKQSPLKKIWKLAEHLLHLVRWGKVTLRCIEQAEIQSHCKLYSGAETKNGEGTHKPGFFALFKFWYRRKLLFRTVKIIKNLYPEDPVFLFSFNKIYFLDCVENLWIRKSQREHFSYKWVIDRPVNWDSLVPHLVVNPPGIQETPVQFLGQKDPLEEG